jgi:Xaa-Pro aminopeptidase
VTSPPSLRQRRGFARSFARRPQYVILLYLLGAWSCHSWEAPNAAGGHYVADVPGISAEEYAARRATALKTLSDGVLVLHARSGGKELEQWGFIQDPTFQYFSGIMEVPGAVLALDGLDGTSHLFLPPAPTSFGWTVEGLIPEPGSETASRYGIESAQPWADFVPWLRGRVRAGATIYVDAARRPEARGAPLDLPPVAGARTLWASALATTFPSARIESAQTAIVEMKAVKSDAEVAILERNARMTVASLLSVAARLEPGVRQRQTEGAMVATCLEIGGQGPSFWPWTMSGPNAHVEQLIESDFHYDQFDRIAQPGELVRVDLGCAGGGYGADVGRTLPASGRFSTGQAEAWNLLIAGYEAGLAAMRDGIPIDAVRAASVEAVRVRQDSMVTTDGRAAADTILSGGDEVWHIHGVGIESGEDIPPVLRAGMVLAYEPGFSMGPDAYYLEDMILVTADGHHVLSDGLPYTADEIASTMAR